MQKGISILCFMFFIPFSIYCQYSKKDIKTFRKGQIDKLTFGERAPLNKESQNFLRYFKPRKKYYVIARFVKAENEKSFEMPTYSGITKTFIKYGTLYFTINGQNETLAVYKNLELQRMPQYKDYLFLPFKDRTSNASTYGGGRYIDIKTTDIENDRVIINFNKSYNPWCAYSDGFNCPVPPKENQLEIAIKAGEKKFVKI